MFKGGKTFRPKKKLDKAGKRYELHKQARATLHAGNLKKAVELPEGENPFEWIAANTVDFFNQINLLYGAVADFCTVSSCPIMNAGPNYEYMWQGPEYPKPTSVPAQKYVELLMAWIQSTLDNPAVFPPTFGRDAPRDFLPNVRKIFKRLLRVYAHLYLAHLQKMGQLGIEAHLNTGFKHFLLFSVEFKLIDDKKEFAPLAGLVNDILTLYGLKL
eukprot:m51a1_g2146 putative mps1 binder-like protein (215) ;mRNA; f:7438-8443